MFDASEGLLRHARLARAVLGLGDAILDRYAGGFAARFEVAQHFANVERRCLRFVR